ncbi:glycoside hydrolase family 19 protein [Leptothrix sp. BB-4]
MCIANSVGRGARNDLVDVAAIQTLLNANLPRIGQPEWPPLEVDGRIGHNTISRIELFETVVMGQPASDGIVAPDDATVAALIAGLPAGPSREKLAIVMPLATARRIDTYFEPIRTALARYQLTSRLQIVHFVAQIGHESASLLYSEELASGEAYNGRADLGNTEPGDGPRYKGRGLIQLTGRANYAAYSRDAGYDYVSDPQRLASDPAAAVDVACWFWKKKGIDRLAEADDAKAVTLRVNGGYNGLDDRLQYLRRAKALI